MSSRWDYIQTLDKLRSSEQATAYGIRGVGDKEVVLLYPSPYRAAMSSLGYQSMYKVANTQPGWRAARATLPDDAPAHLEKQLPILTIEDERPIAAYPVIAVSVAYELEIPGLIDCLRMANLEALTKNRQPTDPLIIAGGPLTFSNPLPMGPFVDIVCMGEGEDLFAQVLQQHQACHFDKAKTLDALHDKPGIWIPDRDGDKLVPVAKVAHKDLPARSAFITPHTELSSMFMTEAVRGCSRGCTYCVMRRSTNGGMRMVDKDVIIDTIPDFAKRVGLVGASVTDHPQIVDIVRAVVEKKGCEVGISSLRADKMTDELASLLVQGGYRTLTVAADGASQRMRNYIERKTKTKHLLRCAEIAKTNKLKTLKMYLMVGIPTETTEDLDELVTMTKDLRNIFPKIAFGIAPFVAKRNTPLDGTEFAGIKVIEKRIGYLRKHLKGAAEIRPTSARWAWVEYILAQGGQEEGLAVLKAHLAGGRFADYKKAFADIKQAPRGRVTFVPSSIELIALRKKRIQTS